MMFRRINLKHAMLAITCVAFLFLACGDGEEAYSNENDNTTTALQTNIVQIETGSSSPDWVKIYIVVTDQEGNPIQNFTVGNFAIIEFQTDSIDIGAGDITLETLTQAGSAIVTPMTMDYSGSMGTQDIADMETAVKTFVGNMQSTDRAEIIKFSSSVEVVQGFTSDQNLLTAAVDSFWPGTGGMTALYDAIYQGIVDACPETGLRAVLAFTDGWENASTHTLSDVIAEALSCQLAVYTVGLGVPDSVNLQLIADTTGGRYYHAPSSQELADLYALISGQLQNAYTLKWNIQSPSGSVIVIVTTSYTCAAGDLEYTATGSFSY